MSLESPRQIPQFTLTAYYFDELVLDIDSYKGQPSTKVSGTNIVSRIPTQKYCKCNN